MGYNEMFPFSENEFDEDFHLENEIMIMKMQAEFGAKIGGSDKIPASVMNDFLKRVYRFEQQNLPSNLISLYERIGKPPYVEFAELSGSELEVELKRLIEILHNHHIELHIPSDCDRSTVYKFITEVIFPFQVSRMPTIGATHHFCLE